MANNPETGAAMYDAQSISCPPRRSRARSSASRSSQSNGEPPTTDTTSAAASRPPKPEAGPQRRKPAEPAQSLADRVMARKANSSNQSSASCRSQPIHAAPATDPDSAAATEPPQPIGHARRRNPEIEAADYVAKSSASAPRRSRSPAVTEAESNAPPPATDPDSAAATEPSPPKPSTRRRKTLVNEGQETAEDRVPDPLVEEIVLECRFYEDLRRARQRLVLQAMAMCRRCCDGDKVEGAKQYAEAMKDKWHPLASALVPYALAMDPLDTAIARYEKSIERLAERLPAVAWAKQVSGLSVRFFGLIVGECRDPVGRFRSVAAVWKRMGLAVIDGERQRRVTGPAAKKHNYVARRRSLMWNIGNSIIKAQTRNPKGEDGKPLGEPVAIGPLGEVYHARKEYENKRNDAGENMEIARKLVSEARQKGNEPIKANLEGKLTPAHINNRAARYMTKRLLRDLFAAWRRLDPDRSSAGTAPETKTEAPTTETSAAADVMTNPISTPQRRKPGRGQHLPEAHHDGASSGEYPSQDQPPANHHAQAKARPPAAEPDADVAIESAAASDTADAKAPSRWRKPVEAEVVA